MKLPGARPAEPGNFLPVARNKTDGFWTAERLMIVWRDRSGRQPNASFPLYRSMLPVSPFFLMSELLPLVLRPDRPVERQDLEAAMLREAIWRTSLRSIAERNEAAPVELGGANERENEEQHFGLMIVEGDDHIRISAAGKDPKAVLDEDWLHALHCDRRYNVFPMWPSPFVVWPQQRIVWS